MMTREVLAVVTIHSNHIGAITMADTEKKKVPLPIQDRAHNEGEDDEITTIDVDGTPVKLDKLGPMIINSNGVSWSELAQRRST